MTRPGTRSSPVRSAAELLDVAGEMRDGNLSEGCRGHLGGGAPGMGGVDRRPGWRYDRAWRRFRLFREQTLKRPRLPPGAFLFGDQVERRPGQKCSRWSAGRSDASGGALGPNHEPYFAGYVVPIRLAGEQSCPLRLHWQRPGSYRPPPLQNKNARGRLSGIPSGVSRCQANRSDDIRCPRLLQSYQCVTLSLHHSWLHCNAFVTPFISSL
jgi:hypothetical protein